MGGSVVNGGDRSHLTPAATLSQKIFSSAAMSHSSQAPKHFGSGSGSESMCGLMSGQLPSNSILSSVQTSPPPLLSSAAVLDTMRPGFSQQQPPMIELGKTDRPADLIKMEDQTHDDLSEGCLTNREVLHAFRDVPELLAWVAGI